MPFHPISAGMHYETLRYNVDLNTALVSDYFQITFRLNSTDSSNSTIIKVTRFASNCSLRLNFPLKFLN